MFKMIIKFQLKNIAIQKVLKEKKVQKLYKALYKCQVLSEAQSITN